MRHRLTILALAGLLALFALAGGTDALDLRGTPNPLAFRVWVQTLAGAGTVTLCEGHLIRVTAAGTVVLPAGAAVGQSCAVVATAANVVSVDVASVADTMTLNGTALAAGNRATSDGTAGAELACVADLANSWRCRAVLATWVDGGA